MTVVTNDINIAMLPEVGPDNWKFTFQAALVRSKETTLLARSLFQDMASAGDFASALEMLSGTDYAMEQSSPLLADVEQMLQDRRRELVEFVTDLISESPISQLPSLMIDMSNIRLAIRRFVTEREIGEDYSPLGSVPPATYQDVFEQEDYSFLPEHMRNAIEQGILSYYQDKDIRAIDFGVDQVEFDSIMALAREGKSSYLAGLAMAGADLSNIKTVMRKKLVESDSMEGFIERGFIDMDKIRSVVLGELDQFSSICYATPYTQIIDAGIEYLNSQNSFLRLEGLCDRYLDGLFDMAGRVTAGVQPVIAYYFKKSDQIRKVRMVLTAKSSMLDKQLILDRLGM